MKNILSFFDKIQDNRQNQGKRYQLKSILALVLIGYMHGYTSLARIYRFSKHLTNTQKIRLGFTSLSTPSHPTITETMKRIDVALFEEAIGQIILALIDSKFTQIAIDGKSIRSTYERLHGLLHLVSAYSTEESGVLAQVKSALAGGEIISASCALSKIDLKGKIVTGDAMFAQESLCTQITESEGDFLFKVKRNKKRIVDDIDQEFHYYKNKNLPILSFEAGASKAHGRIDLRRVEVIEVRDKYFGGLDTIKQIARITRTYYTMKTKEEKSVLHYVMTSLSSKKASPEDLLKLSVGHWMIENKLHRTRDTNFKEDTCNILSHESQQNNAAMRNLAIFLLNKIHSSITRAIETVTYNIKLAFSLLFRRI
jgi:predicted transposase YbfD/YdcC